MGASASASGRLLHITPQGDLLHVGSRDAADQESTVHRCENTKHAAAIKIKMGWIWIFISPVGCLYWVLCVGVG